MSSALVYSFAGVALLVVGAWALVLRPHLVSKVLAVNVMVSGIFLVFVSGGSPGGGHVDPVPQAMVITGIVVAVSATALALAITLRIADRTGRAALPEDRGRDLRDEDDT